LIVVPFQLVDVRGFPAFEPYLVKVSLPVETLAQQLSVSPTSLKNFNGFKTAEPIAAGDWVLIPYTSNATPTAIPPATPTTTSIVTTTSTPTATP